MNPIANAGDCAFRDRFEAGLVRTKDFGHREHLLLAYVYLCDFDVNTAQARMRAALVSFLEAKGVPAGKYHETLTRAWLLAVRHFMARAGDTQSFGAFLESDNRLLDPGIMLTHYSREMLFSDRARVAFVEPDRQAIPLH